MTDALTSDPSSPRFQEETRGFLQRRLRLSAGAVATITGILLGAFFVTLALSGGGLLRLVPVFVVGFPNGVLFWMVALTGSLYVALRRREWSTAWLGVIDAALLMTLIVPCLLLYGRLHDYSFSGFAAVVPFLTLFVLARAVLVPSSALRTAVLSAPAAVGSSSLSTVLRPAGKRPLPERGASSSSSGSSQGTGAVGGL